MMTKMFYEQPTIEIEFVVCEQGFTFSSGVDIEDGGENGGESDWV